MQAWTLLFDIDGTIMTSAHAGTNAMATTAQQLYGLEKIGPLEVHGRCDRGILAELFKGLNLSFEEHREAFTQKYLENLPASLIENQGRLLPGIKTLLEQLAGQDNVALGLLTGNLEKAAHIKLQHVGVDHFFSFGGFGDNFANRNDVAAAALASAQAAVGERFDPAQVWVIGDTVNDITCARSIGAKVLAVETGGGTKEQLSDASPDLILPNLSAPAPWLSLLV